MCKKKIRAMKKKYAALFFLTILALFSCNKEDFDPNDYEKNIIGEWRLVHEYNWRRYLGREPVISEVDKTKDKTIYIFKENNSLTYQHSFNYSGQEEFFEKENIYEIVDGRIVFDGDYETAEKILSLTPTELKTEVHFMDEVNHTYKEIYSVYTYKRQ